MQTSPVTERKRKAIAEAALPLTSLAIVRLDGEIREGIVRYVDTELSCLELFPLRTSAVPGRRSKGQRFDAERATGMRGTLFGRVYAAEPYNRCVFQRPDKVRVPPLGSLRRLQHQLLDIVTAFAGFDSVGVFLRLLLPPSTAPAVQPTPPPRNRPVSRGWEYSPPVLKREKPVKLSPEWTALMELISMGAGEASDVSAVPQAELDAVDTTFRLPLLSAAVTFKAPIEVLQALCARGANPLATNPRTTTPLHVALDKGDVERAAVLLAATPNPSAALLASNLIADPSSPIETTLLQSPLQAALASRKAKTIVPVLIRDWFSGTDLTVHYSQLQAAGYGLEHPLCSATWVAQFSRAPAKSWLQHGVPHSLLTANMGEAAAACFAELARVAPPQVLDARDPFGLPLAHLAIRTANPKVVASLLAEHPHAVWLRDVAGRCSLRALLQKRALYANDFDTMLESVVTAREASATPPTRSADANDRAQILIAAMACAHQTPVVARLADSLARVILDGKSPVEGFADALCTAVALRRGSVVEALLNTARSAVDPAETLRTPSPLFDNRNAMAVAIGAGYGDGVETLLKACPAATWLEPWHAEEDGVAWPRSVVGAILRSGTSKRSFHLLAEGIPSMLANLSSKDSASLLMCALRSHGGDLDKLALACPVDLLVQKFEAQPVTLTHSVSAISAFFSQAPNDDDASPLLPYVRAYLLCTDLNSQGHRILMRHAWEGHRYAFLKEVLRWSPVVPPLPWYANAVLRRRHYEPTEKLLELLRDKGWILSKDCADPALYWPELVRATSDVRKVVDLLSNPPAAIANEVMVRVALSCMLLYLREEDLESALVVFQHIEEDLAVGAASVKQTPRVNFPVCGGSSRSVPQGQLIAAAVRRSTTCEPCAIACSLVCDVNVPTDVCSRFIAALCSPVGMLRVAVTCLSLPQRDRAATLLAAAFEQCGPFEGSDVKSRGIAALVNAFVSATHPVNPDDVAAKVIISGGEGFTANMATLIGRIRPERTLAPDWPIGQQSKAPCSLRHLVQPWSLHISLEDFSIHGITTAAPDRSVRVTLFVEPNTEEEVLRGFATRCPSLPDRAAFTMAFASRHLVSAVVRSIVNSNYPCEHFAALHYVLRHWPQDDAAAVVTAAVQRLSATSGPFKIAQKCVGVPRALLDRGHIKEAEAFAQHLASIIDGGAALLTMQCLCVGAKALSDDALMAFMANAFGGAAAEPKALRTPRSLAALIRAGRLQLFEKQFLLDGCRNDAAVLVACAYALASSTNSTSPTLLQDVWRVACATGEVETLGRILEACVVHNRVNLIQDLISVAPSAVSRPALQVTVCRVGLGCARLDAATLFPEALRSDDVSDDDWWGLWPAEWVGLPVPEQAVKASSIQRMEEQRPSWARRISWPYTEQLLTPYLLSVLHSDMGDVDPAVTTVLRQFVQSGDSRISSLAIACNAAPHAAEKFVAWLLEDLWFKDASLPQLEAFLARQSRNGKICDTIVRLILQRRGQAISPQTRQEVLENAAAVGATVILKAFSDDRQLMYDVSTDGLVFAPSVPTELRTFVSLKQDDLAPRTSLDQRSFYSPTMDLDADANNDELKVQMHTPVGFTGTVQVTCEGGSRVPRRAALSVGIPPQLENFLASKRANELVQTLRIRFNAYADLPVSYTYDDADKSLLVAMNPTAVKSTLSDAHVDVNTSPDRWRYSAAFDPPLPEALQARDN